MGEDHPTEAACLLEQGASYRRRIGLKPRATSGDPIFAGFKQGAFSLYFGDAPIYHFDLEGRWQDDVIRDGPFMRYILLNATFITVGMVAIVELLPPYAKNDAGVTEKQIDQMLVGHPRDIFAATSPY